jgi:hypothetical protein
MNSPEKNRQVFVVRIWREAREIEGKLPEWRGMIESVHSGERRYLKNLGDIAAFIAPYLCRMGVKLDRYGPVWGWLIRRWPSAAQHERLDE